MQHLRSQIDSLKGLDNGIKSQTSLQDAKQEALKRTMKQQGGKIKKLISDTEMHFNITLGLSQKAQSQKNHLVGSKFMEEDTIQKPTISIMDISSSKETSKEEKQLEEGHSGHVFL